MNKKLKIIMATSLALGITSIPILPSTKANAAVNPITQNVRQATISNTVTQNGWVKLDGKYYYYVNGVKQTGWIHPDNYYYMDANGVMQTGWIKLDGKYYYLNDQGAMQTGWFQDTNGKWYYLNSDGSMKTGWFQDTNGEWYYLNDDGSMKTGWIQYQDKWCYLNTTSGEMVKGQVVSDANGSYYIDSNGYWYNTQGQKAVDKACEQLGKNYVYGASGPDTFDCSGLVQYCYGQIGISLARDTYGQVNEGYEVSSSDLQPGDLIFPSSGHVQIYIGDGKVIHAPQTGDVVKISKLSTVWHARRVS